MSAATSFARELPVAKAILGKNVVVEGHIRSQEDLIIEGEVEGTIDMIEHRLTIATNGKVRANVKLGPLGEFWQAPPLPYGGLGTACGPGRISTQCSRAARRMSIAFLSQIE